MFLYKSLEDQGLIKSLVNIMKSVRDGVSVRPINNIFPEEKASFRWAIRRANNDERLEDNIVVSDQDNDRHIRMIVVQCPDKNVDCDVLVQKCVSLRRSYLDNSITRWYTLLIPENYFNNIKQFYTIVFVSILLYMDAGLACFSYQDIKDTMIAKRNFIINRKYTLELMYAIIKIMDDLCDLKYSDKEEIVSQLISLANLSTLVGEYTRNSVDKDKLKNTIGTLYDHIIETPDVRLDNEVFYEDVLVNFANCYWIC